VLSSTTGVPTNSPDLQAAHDRGHLARTFEFVAQLYGRDWVGQSKDRSNASPRPVFIIGTPRSGTSLASRFLPRIPQCSARANCPSGRSPRRRRLRRPRGRIRRRGVVARGPDYLQLLAGLSAGALRVVDKMPANFAYLGLIHAALPQARIIHMRRNPIDSCLSIYFQNFHVAHSYANDLDDLAHFYGEYERVMDHWRSILPQGTILDVPYEGLVQDPEAWSRAMVDFIGLPWDPACLDFHRTNRSVSTFSKWQVRQKITQSSVERWRNYENFVGR